MDLIGALREAGRPVVFNWGFPVQFLNLVRRLIDSGMEHWWLGDDREACGRSFRSRATVWSKAFLAYRADLEPQWHRVAAIFAGRIIPTVALSPDGHVDHMAPNEVWKRINEGSGTPAT
jgi:hypothetical protein